MMKLFRRNSQKENRGNAATNASSNMRSSTDAKPLINLTVICPAMGDEHDQVIAVQCSPGETIGNLKLRLQDLSHIPYEFLDILQDPQGQPMDDNEVLGFNEGDVVFLQLSEIEAQSFPMGEDAWAHGDECVDEMIDDLEDDAEQEAFDQALADSIKDVQYCLSFLLPAVEAREERRCNIPIGASALIADVADVVRLELGLGADESFCLHFAGQPLSPDSTVHAAGLREDDTVFVGLSPDLLE